MSCLRERSPFVWCALLALCCATTACVGSDRRGTPLYKDGPHGRAEIALLVGPVTRVDGAEVPGSGHSFELMPGCHIVEIGGKEGAISPQYGAWVASFPHLTYAFRMQSKSTYTIDFAPDATLGQASTGWGTVVARERDAQGHVRVLPRAQNAADVAKCRQ